MEAIPLLLPAGATPASSPFTWTYLARIRWQIQLTSQGLPSLPSAYPDFSRPQDPHSISFFMANC